MVLREKCVKTGEKASIFKTLCNFRPTPKPWVAGSNPPAPAKNKKVDATHRLFCFSLWTLWWRTPPNFAERQNYGWTCAKAKRKFIANYRASRGSESSAKFWHSNNSNCSNRSVWYSIKKAATVSTELQKSVRATANFNCCGSPFIFDYSDAIFDVL